VTVGDTSPEAMARYADRLRALDPAQRLAIAAGLTQGVLRKLLFRDGGSVSERQWRDVVEVLRHAGTALDAGYLDGWATRLGVAELLAGARLEARPR
jgi:hypothetical protein